MVKSRLDMFIHHVRLAVGGTAAAECTDRQMLERFLAAKEEAAFAELVRRHGPMVRGVCRRILGREHDTDDAFQATFLVLFRKAAAVVHYNSLASWLHQVACRVAMKARTTLARRRALERKRGAMATEESGDDAERDVAHRDLERVLDEELQDLPSDCRDPIVLCYLEGKTHAEAADELGWPRGSMAKRLTRAQELLRGRLTRRGLAMSTALVAASLSQAAAEASVPASPALVAETVRSTLACATGETLGMSLRAVALADSVCRGMFLTKWKLVCALLFVLAPVAGAGGFLLASHGTQATNANVAEARQESKSGLAAPVDSPVVPVLDGENLDALRQSALDKLAAVKKIHAEVVQDARSTEERLNKRKGAFVQGLGLANLREAAGSIEKADAHIATGDRLGAASDARRHYEEAIAEAATAQQSCVSAAELIKGTSITKKKPGKAPRSGP